VISQFYQESRELKRKIVERGSEEKTPQRKIDPMQEISNEKEVMQNPNTIVLAKPTNPLTRSSARKKSSKTQGQVAAREKPPTLPTEGEKNIRWMNKKLREAHRSNHQYQGRK
jgi:hypothetical protein